MLEKLRTLLPSDIPVYIIVNFMGLGCHFFECFSTWVISAIYQNRIELIINSFVKVEKILRKLGMPDNDDKVFRESAIQVTAYNLLFLTTMIFTMIMWSSNGRFDTRISVSFTVPSIVPFYMVLLFVLSLVYVRQKLRRLNEKIQNLMHNDYPEDNNPYMDESQFSCDADVLSNKIEMISQLHRELRHVIHCIERHSALPILCSLIDSFVFTVLNIYGIFHYIKISESVL